MATRLADRLSLLRRQCVVGREQERALFRNAVTAPELPFHVLHVTGPGGIGKTTLLREFLAICAQAGVAARYVDARDLDPTPAGFLAAVADAPGAGSAPVDADDARRVLLVDTYETLRPLDAWLRDRFLPEQPAETLVVLAGREPPQPGWRSDPGWQALVRTVHLRNLPPAEVQRYLERRGIPAARHDAALAFTHGHPLALSLVADHLDQHPDAELRADEAPDIVRELLGAFASALPSPAHRTTLEACALVRGLTEGLLGEMLGPGDGDDAHALFEWLRGLSFVESGAHGLFPHDLARDALAADLRWRNPDRYAVLHRRARAYYAARLRQTRGAEQQGVLMDYVHLHRDNPVVRPFFEWRHAGGLLTDALRPEDVPALVAMTARHEGEESARLAACWLARAPGAAVVVRDADGAPAGWMLALPLAELAPDDVAADPATAAAWRYVCERAPLRAGERATLFRYWMARDAYQGVSPVQSLVFVTAVQHYLGTPGLAVTLFPCAAPEFWAPVFAYADLARLPEADFVVGGRRAGAYGHDWRITPPLAWLELLGERELGASADATRTAAACDVVALPARAAAAPPPVAVLGEAEFAVAVHDALRRFASPRALRQSALLRARLVAARAGSGAGEAQRAASLQALLRAAAAELRASPRDARLYDVLHHAYFHPAPSQERAAEILRVSFSTFRRHLKAAVDRVTDVLWQWELDPAAVPGEAAERPVLELSRGVEARQRMAVGG